MSDTPIPDATPRNPITAWMLLAAGDAIVFAFFAVQGRATHQIPLGASPIATTIEVAAPFAVPWFVLAALTGAFRRATVTRPKRMLSITAAAWIVAGSIGLIARSIIVHRAPVASFAAVALGLNAALLLAWRGAFSVVAARRAKADRHAG